MVTFALMILRIFALVPFLFLCHHLQSQSECDTLGIDIPLNLTVESNPSEICPNSEFCLDFSTENFQSVVAFQFTISFDPRVLSFVDFTDERELRGSIAYNSTNSDKGKIPVLWIDNLVEGVTVEDSLSIFTICYEAIGEANDELDLFFNSNNRQSFPITEVTYQNDQFENCVSNEIKINGSDSLNIQLCCNELSLVDLNTCIIDSLSFRVCGGILPYQAALIDASGNTIEVINILNDGDESSFDFMGVGEFFLSIIDGNNNSIDTLLSREDTSPIFFDLETVDPVCSFLESGIIEISNIQGGTPPYEIMTERGEFVIAQDEATFTGFGNGTHFLFIRDASGCEIAQAVTFATPELIVNIDIVEPTCTSSDDGSITITAEGGTPFPNNEYDINNIVRSAFTELSPLLSNFYNPADNTFGVRVEDMNACSVNLRVDIPTLFSPGDTCDDQDPATVNDRILDNCSCEGSSPDDLVWIGDTTEFLPSDIIVTVPFYSSGFIFPNGLFQDPITSMQYPFPLEQGVHFDGINNPVFSSNRQPTDLFQIGNTTVEYTIIDDLLNELAWSFDISVQTYIAGIEVSNIEIGSVDTINMCQDARQGFCTTCTIDVTPVIDGISTINADSIFGSFVWSVDPSISGSFLFDVNPAEDGFFFPTIENALPDNYTICLLSIETAFDDWEGMVCQSIDIIDCMRVDNDGDGFSVPEDCDDNNINVFPGAEEICDGKDNDCDGGIDEGLNATFFVDNDRDGFGDSNQPVQGCELIDGLSINSDDCDDNNAEVLPGASEICDNIDNNCDGVIDEGLTTQVYFRDADFDSFGNPMDSIISCFQPFGFVDNNQDCNDDDENVNPDATELCDSVDNNCDGVTDEGLSFITYFVDADRDGFGDPTTGFDSCVQPPDLVTDNTDCDDTNPNINPAAIEILGNFVDENCDGRDNTTSTVDVNDIDYNIYPNPTNDVFLIRGIEYNHLAVRDRLGRLVLSLDQYDQPNLKGYPDGIYFISIFDKKGNIIGVNKLLKNNKK